MSRAGRLGLIVVFVVIAIVTASTVRVVTASRAELSRARLALQVGEVGRAIRHYRRAMRWYAPFSPYPGQARAALEKLARRLEAEADVEGAISAWRAVSGGSTATRVLWGGQDLVRERADDEIARLLAAHGRVPIDAGLERNALQSSHRLLLRGEVGADPFWGSLLLFGFAGWIVGLIACVAYGFDRSGRASWPGVRIPLSMALIGLFLSILGMLFA